MDYLVVFVGGLGVGLAFSFWMKLAYIKHLRKELRLDDKPIANPYARGEEERAKYKPRTMWGPRGDEQGR